MGDYSRLVVRIENACISTGFVDVLLVLALTVCSQLGILRIVPRFLAWPNQSARLCTGAAWPKPTTPLPLKARLKNLPPRHFALISGFSLAKS